jgi:hypothetical protein
MPRHNGDALQRSSAPLMSDETSYPGLRPTVRVIAEFALRGQAREPVHQAARQALREGGAEPIPLPKQTPEWRERAARAIYEWMGPNVTYAHDPEGIEQVQEPTATLMLGQGDCDDMVSLAIAMLTSVGVPARIKVIRQTGSDVYNHIYAEYEGSRHEGSRYEGSRHEGTTRGRGQWKAFDPTLRRPEKGEYGQVGDGPDPSLIAESVQVPVTGGPRRLGPETEAALRQLPADEGVVPDRKLQRERTTQSPPGSPQSAPSAMSKKLRSPSGRSRSRALGSNRSKAPDGSRDPSTPSSGGLPNTENSVPTRRANLTLLGQAPGSSKATGAAKQEEEVIVVPPSRYANIVEQAVTTGDFECTVEGRIVIRDGQGREILPSSDTGGPITAGLPGWLTPLLFATGGVALIAALTRDDSSDSSQGGGSNSGSSGSGSSN